MNRFEPVSRQPSPSRSARVRRAAAPVPLLVRDASQAHGAQVAEVVTGELAPLLEPDDLRPDPIPHVGPDRGDEVALLGGEAEVPIHRPSSLPADGGRWGRLFCAECAFTTR